MQGGGDKKTTGCGGETTKDHRPQARGGGETKRLIGVCRDNPATFDMAQ